MRDPVDRMTRREGRHEAGHDHADRVGLPVWHGLTVGGAPDGRVVASGVSEPVQRGRGLEALSPAL